MRGDLECIDGRGSWAVLRRLGVPAAIKLLASDGTRHWVAVTALDEYSATVELRNVAHTVPLAALDRLWDGLYTVVWRPLPGPLRVLKPGSQGPGVAWLRRGLGGDTSARPAGVYDEALADRVAAFQKQEGLEADGVAGMETLVRLSVQLDRRAPLLAAAPAAR
jgi:general secretion pathway protein A